MNDMMDINYDSLMNDFKPNHFNDNNNIKNEDKDKAKDKANLNNIKYEDNSILKEFKNEKIVNIINKYDKDINLEIINNIDDKLLKLIILLETVRGDLNKSELNIIRNEMFKEICNLGINKEKVAKIFKACGKLLDNEVLLDSSDGKFMK
jgi:hypothetical protein